MMLKNHSLKQEQNASTISAGSLDQMIVAVLGMEDDALLTLRHTIDKQLRLDLSKLDLSDELGLQYRSGMTLLASVQGDVDTPANQRAQVFNSVNSMLTNIVKTQESIYSMERLKKYEIAFLEAAKTLPVEAKEAFFNLYGEYLSSPCS